MGVDKEGCSDLLLYSVFEIYQALVDSAVK